MSRHSLLLLIVGLCATHPSPLGATSLRTQQPPIELSQAAPPMPAPTTSIFAQEMRTQRAWMYSALVPGCGQIYNRHYQKVPIMYLCAAALAGGALYNHTYYEQAKARRSQRAESLAEDFSRNRDLFLIFLGLLYAGNILDAYVGASLKTLSLSDDLLAPVDTLSLRPSGPGGLLLTLNYRL